MNNNESDSKRQKVMILDSRLIQNCLVNLYNLPSKDKGLTGLKQARIVFNDD